MAGITDWHGNNNKNWGDRYESSNFGNTNETNYWGIIYPFNADQSEYEVDIALILADRTDYTVDQTVF
jgi:hypothetical protein